MSQSMLEIMIKAVDEASAPLRKIAEQIERMSKAEGLERLGNNLEQVGQKFQNGVTRPIMAGLKASATASIDFESAMADVTKVMGLLEPETDAVGAALMRMSREIPISAVGLAEIAAAGGQLGIKKEGIEEFVEITAKMSTAFDMTAADAGKAVARLMNVYSLNMDGARSLGDVINQLSNTSAAAASEIVDVGGRIGGVARQFGLTQNEAVALGGAIVALGRTPEEAGTAINGILPVLQTATGQTTNFKEGLQMAGLSAQELEQAIATDAVGGLNKFIAALGQMDRQQAALALQKMFGSGTDSAILAQLAQDASQLEKNFKLVGDSANYAGSMQGEFASRSATTANQLQLLRNATTELGTGIGDAIKPAIDAVAAALIPLIHGITAFVAANPGVTTMAIAFAGLAASVGPILMALGTIATGISAIASAGPAIAMLKTAFAGIGSSALALLGILAAIPLAIFAIGARMAGLNLSIGEFISALGASIQAGIASIGQIPGAMTGVASAVVNIARAMAANVVTGFRVMMSRAASAISAGAGAAVGAMRAVGSAILGAIRGIAGQVFSAGAQIVQRLAAGIASGIGAVASAAKSVAAAVMSALPNSPVPEGPLTALNNIRSNPGAKIVEMLAAGMRSASLSDAVGVAVSPAVSPAALVARGNQAGAAVGGGNAFNITINVAGSGDVAPALERQIRDVIARINADQRRLSYG